jgi:Gram-negative bacterial TonB protein C-terminal
MPPATVSFLVACALIQALPTQGAFTPARLRSGPVPPLPALVTGGGQVALELTVNPDGRVAAVTPLVTTPPFTDFMVQAVRDWQFQPAEVEAEAEREAPASARSRQRVASKVLAIGVFRQPALVGPTIGEIPKGVTPPSDEMAFPVNISTPPYPVTARDPGVVLVEVRIELDGRVGDAAALTAAPPFDALAVQAARESEFRPARVRGRPVMTRAYIVFGFAEPVGPGD